MNKISKQYVKNARVFFPSLGKNERNYLRNIESNIEDFCEEVSISSLDELYEKFGTPSEIAQTYYSNLNTDDILKQISKTKWLKRFILSLIIVAFMSSLTYSAYLYSQYQILKNESVFFEEVIIK